MTDFDIYGGFTRVNLKTPGTVTTSANSTGVDRLNYAGTQAVVSLVVPAGTGTTPTLDAKIQDSADNSSFADVSGAAFTQVTTALSVQHIAINLDSCRRYLRVAFTTSGTTPSYTPAVLLTCISKQ